MQLHQDEGPIVHPQKVRNTQTSKTVHPTAYKETPTKGSAKSNKGGKPKTKSIHKHPDKVAQSIQATNLPAPIPEVPPPSAPSLQIVVPPASALPLITPTLSPTTAYGFTSTIWVYATDTAISPVPDSSKTTTKAVSANHLSVVIIVLIAIGSACGLVAAVLVLKYCILRKFRRTRHPTPSAPILQESPLFGGNDRFARWSDASFGNLAATSSAKAGLGLGKGDGWKPLYGGNDAMREKPRVVAPRFPPAAVSPASMYPLTPAAPAERIAIALEQSPPPSTYVMPPPNLPPPAGAVSKKPVDDRRLSRHSIASSMYGGVEMHSPVPSLPYLSSHAVASPGKTKQGLPPSRPSRERVQAPYRRGDSSAQASLPKAQTAQRLGRDEPPIQYSIPTVKSLERKERDTRALTSALGLASPVQPTQHQQPVSCFSPASVYPDDSVSRRETRASYVTDTPNGGMAAALGSLMLQDFPFPSVPTITNMPPPPLEVKKKQPPKPAGAQMPASQTQTSTRIDNLPPRVPSPPPMPSLAQMAMQSSNPDYRSPTYSIYGLYSDRKSAVTGL